DPGAADELVRVLRAGGAEVHRATEPFHTAVHRVDAGDVVVTLAQPFGRWIKDLLEPQRYPDPHDAPRRASERPYDGTARAPGMQLGVDIRFVDEPLAGARLDRLEADPVRHGRLTGSGRVFAFRREMNAAATLANRLLAEGAELAVLREPLDDNG